MRPTRPLIVTPRPHVPLYSQEQGEPLFFQPPAFRNTASQARTAYAGSSADPPKHDPGKDPENHPLVPSNISDLEDRSNRAAEQGEAPRRQVANADGDNLMQSTMSGPNTQDVSWIWGATPSTLPPTFPLDSHSIRGPADGSWRGVVWKPAMGQEVFHPKQLRHEPTAVVFNTLESFITREARCLRAPDSL